MAEVFGQATTFQIAELTGEKRTLVLAGRALPYRPIKLSGSQRAEFTWYPGNPEATVQVLGAEEKSTTFNGAWKDRFIKDSSFSGGQQVFTAIAELDGSQVASADDLVHTVDDFRRKGQLIEVRWGSQVRRGIMTEFTSTYERMEDIEWDMTFGWISQGDAQSAAVLSGQSDLGRIKSAWDGKADDILAAIESPPFDFGLLGDTLPGIATQIVDRISEVTDAVVAVAKSTSTPKAMADRLNSVYESIKDSCDSLVDTAQSVPPADLFKFAANDLQDGEPRFASLLKSESWVEDLLVAARTTRRQAVENQADLASTVSSDLLGIVTAREDEDLREISTSFYGTPTGWRRLMKFNGLTQSRLSAGELVLVPPLTTETS